MINIYTSTAQDILSLEELDLYHLLMDYRAENGLAAIPLSEGLTETAGRHVLDTRENIWAAGLDLPQGANLHSWSDAPYYGDHSEPEAMWEAPSRLGTSYTGYGFEISAAGYADIEAALEGWILSPGHNDVMINLNGWSNFEWTAIGIGVETQSDFDLPYAGRAYHVWFGYEQDPAGAPEIIGSAQAETITGTAFDDLITPGGGNDTINAGLGFDQITLDGRQSDFIISRDSGDIVLLKSDTGELVRTNSVEAFNFSDGLRYAADFSSVSARAPAISNLPAGGYDLNGDGYDDVMAVNKATGEAGLVSALDASWQSVNASDSDWKIVGFGNFDGNDASDDVLFHHENSSKLGRMDFDGNSSSWSVVATAGSDWRVVGAGDFDGDGTDDILWMNTSTGAFGQYRMGANGVADWFGLGKSGTGWDLAGLGDFNGDGTTDILWHNANLGTLGLFNMTAQGASWSGLTGIGAGYEVAATGDFWNAGSATRSEADDILVYNADSRNFGQLDVFIDQNGATQINWYSLGVAGAGWEIEGTGDFNGDGREDILWQHSGGQLGQYSVNGADISWSNLPTVTEDWNIIL